MSGAFDERARTSGALLTTRQLGPFFSAPIFRDVTHYIDQSASCGDAREWAAVSFAMRPPRGCERLQSERTLIDLSTRL